MESILFEPAEQSDIPIVTEILTDATQHKVELGDLIWGKEGWTEKEVQDYMSESTVYLIRQGQEVVGTVSLQWDDERNWGPQPPIAGYMHRLAVREGHYGQGLGEAIIASVSQMIQQEGKELLRLDCEARNTALCSYYEKLGFQKVGERHVPEYGDYVAALYERPV